MKPNSIKPTPARPSRHLSEDIFMDLAMGGLPPDQKRLADGHLRKCLICRRTLAVLQEVNRLRDDEAAPPPPEMYIATADVGLHRGMMKKLYLHACGKDGPGILSFVTSRLEAKSLSIDAVTFDVERRGERLYQLEITAYGRTPNVEAARAELNGLKAFLLGMGTGAKPNSFTDPCLLEFDIVAPDRPGLTADITALLSQYLTPEDQGIPEGNIVELHGSTINGEQLPEGCAAAFRLHGQAIMNNMKTAMESKNKLKQWTLEEPNASLGLANACPVPTRMETLLMNN
jgi:hypothetical protein